MAVDRPPERLRLSRVFAGAARFMRAQPRGLLIVTLSTVTIWGVVIGAPVLNLIAPILWLFLVIPISMLQAIVAKAYAAFAAGKSGSVREAFDDLAEWYYALFRFLLNQYLWVGLGLLLIAPGLFLAARWFVSVPAAAVEHARDPLGRSAELTRGSRGPLVLLAAGLVVLWFAPFGVHWVVLMMFTGHLPKTGLLILTLGVLPILWTIVQFAWAILPAVAFVELRALKEGPRPA